MYFSQGTPIFTKPHIRVGSYFQNASKKNNGTKVLDAMHHLCIW